MSEGKAYHHATALDEKSEWDFAQNKKLMGIKTAVIRVKGQVLRV